jgi:hypothetical protein
VGTGSPFRLNLGTIVDRRGQQLALLASPNSFGLDSLPIASSPSRLVTASAFYFFFCRI